MNLETYIAEHTTKPFEWGKNDCVTFCAGAIKVATGIDHLRHIKKWNNAFTGKKALKKAHHKNFFEAFDVRFRQHENLNKLKDGDVVLKKNPHDKSFSEYSALVYYKGKLIGIEKNGLITFPVDSGDYYFNVRSLRLRGRYG